MLDQQLKKPMRDHSNNFAKMGTNLFLDFQSQLISADKTISFLLYTIEAKSDQSKKLADEMKEFVQTNMMKFSQEMKSSLANIYRDFKSM